MNRTGSLVWKSQPIKMRERKDVWYLGSKEGSIQVTTTNALETPQVTSSHVLLTSPHLPSHVGRHRLNMPTAAAHVPARGGALPHALLAKASALQTQCPLVTHVTAWGAVQQHSPHWGRARRWKDPEALMSWRSMKWRSWSLVTQTSQDYNRKRNVLHFSTRKSAE